VFYYPGKTEATPARVASDLTNWLPKRPWLGWDPKLLLLGSRTPCESGGLRVKSVLQLSWQVEAMSGNWISLDTFNFSTIATFGVYIIWHGKWITSLTPARTIRVGQGNIWQRLPEHHSDPAVTWYRQFGPLAVTWATVSPLLVDGVERFLASRLNPLIGDRFPNAVPIAVNLPW
jgi:hypothetical protein